jgi:hypothetical protein
MNLFSEESWKQSGNSGVERSPLSLLRTKPDGVTPKEEYRDARRASECQEEGEIVFWTGPFRVREAATSFYGQNTASNTFPVGSGKMRGSATSKRRNLPRPSNRRRRVAPAAYCVFKPIEKFLGPEKPEVVVFFASPDILAGLFTLTNYAQEMTDVVQAPFCSGCAAILTFPLKEAEKETPRPVLGMFDVSARPMVEKDILTLSMPYSVFLKLLENVKGSFLETESWKKVLQDSEDLISAKVESDKESPHPCYKRTDGGDGDPRDSFETVFNKRFQRYHRYDTSRVKVVERSGIVNGLVTVFAGIDGCCHDD